MRISILNLGYQYALKSPEYPFKLACIIFKGKKIFSIGYNEVRSSINVPQKYKLFKESLHAEVAALMKFKPGELKGCSAFVCRVNAGSKRTSNATCCARCQEMFFDYGIKKVYCTNELGTVDEYLVKAPDENFQPILNHHDYREVFFKKIIHVI